MTSTVMFNPFAPTYCANPYPHLAELRAADPVHQHPIGFWLLTRHEDINAVLRSGMSVELRNLADGALRQGRQEAVGDDQWEGAELSMLDRDPPDHTRLRRLVSKAFNRRAVAALESRVVRFVDDALDRIAEAGAVNLISALAFPLPFTVISDMLGMPPSIEGLRVRELSGTVVRSVEPGNNPDLQQAIDSANRELAKLAAEAVAWKRENPGDDLLTALIEAEDQGDVLNDDELVAQIVLLLIGGHETTVNLLGNGTLALLRNPDQLALLRSQPDLIENAVEELLRYDAPVQISKRITTEPYPLRDKVIPAGSFVLNHVAAAGRDDLVFGADADQLRLDRPDARNHMSFGAGVHHCIGAVLARMEGRVAIGRLVERFPRLRLTGEPSWNGRITLRGMTELPVAV
ncbi:MAG: cytochrome P450 [Labedaea sp.]